MKRKVKLIKEKAGMKSKLRRGQRQNFFWNIAVLGKRGKFLGMGRRKRKTLEKLLSKQLSVNLRT